MYETNCHLAFCSSGRCKNGGNILRSNRIFRKITAILMVGSTLLLPGCNKKKKPAEKAKVILDCDMGAMNDDTLALSMLLQEEKAGKIEVVGITLEGGNVLIDAEFESEGMVQTSAWDSTQSFLEKIGRTDLPVYRGTDIPEGFTIDTISEVSKYYETTDYLLYCDAYGAIHAYEHMTAGALCDSDEASKFLIDTVKEHPGEVVIIATGPTMNIARAIEQDTSFAPNVQAIYYMGGALGARYEETSMKGNHVQAITGANVTPFAEYNVLYDPASFYTCITADFPRQVISPAEMSMPFDEQTFKELKDKGSEGNMAKVWIEQYEVLLPDYPYWDPIIAYAYIRPAQVTTAEQYVTVNTDREDPEFGATYGISAEEYNGLSELEKQEYGKILVVTGVNDFWKETIDLLVQK